MNRCVTSALAFVALAALSGCADDGELGHGRFHYVCMSEHDMSCDRFDFDDLDNAVAVGATFDLEYRRDVNDPAAQLRFAGVNPASPQVAERLIDGDARGMRFLVHGEGAFLAQSPDGTVVDFVHMFATEVVAIDLDGESVFLEDMGMRSGDTSTVTAYPLGLGGEHLMGTMRCTWSNADDTIVSTSDENSCALDVSAVAPGTTTLTVTMNESVEQTLTVSVEAQP